jgi:hypothetical protein
MIKLKSIKSRFYTLFLQETLVIYCYECIICVTHCSEQIRGFSMMFKVNGIAVYLDT